MKRVGSCSGENEDIRDVTVYRGRMSDNNEFSV